MFKWSNTDVIAIPIALVLILGLAVLFYFVLKNKSDKVKHIPLYVVAISLVVLEVTKQIYHAVRGTYNVNTIPVHFCSLIVVIICLAEFLPKKISKYFNIPSVVFSLITLGLLLIHPSSMIGKSSANIFGNFSNFHAFMFHIIVIAYPIFKLAILRHKISFKQSLSLVVCVLFYATYAVPVAFALNNNYVNIIYSYFAPLENFRNTCGQVAYDVLLFIIVIAVSYAVFGIWYLIEKLIEKRRLKNA